MESVLAREFVASLVTRLSHSEASRQGGKQGTEAREPGDRDHIVECIIIRMSAGDASRRVHTQPEGEMKSKALAPVLSVSHLRPALSSLSLPLHTTRLPRV